MGFKDYLSVISRRWFIFAPLAASVIGAHLLWVAFGQPQLFRATTMIVLSPPLTGGGFPFIRPITPISRVETFREPPILNSALQLLAGERPFISKVFDEPGRREEIKVFTEQFAAQAAAGNSRQLLQEIEQAATVSVGKDERVITIDAASADPRRALAISWAIAEAARIYHNERCRETVEKTVAELQSQRKEYESERELALRDRTEFAKRTGFTNFPRYQEMVQGIILSIDGEISQNRGQQREIERMIDERVSRSQQGGDEIQAVAAELGESSRLKNLHDQLLKLKLDHDIAISRLTDRHPSIADMRVKIDRMERLIADEHEAIVSDGLKKWSSATRDLVKQSAAIALKLDVLKERKASLSRELFRLAEVSQEYGRIDERAALVAANIERVKGHINELEWAGLQAAGQVQLHNPSDEARALAKRGTGAGAISLSFLMALIFALGVVYVLEYIDTRVKTEGDVRRYLGLPLLGTIPCHREHLITDDVVKGVVPERFNTAATLIRSTARELGMKSFTVSSAVPQEGKTTVSINLAAALARKGARVILVDADLRAPRIHEALNLPNRAGLTTILESRLDSRRIIDGVLSDNEGGGGSLGASEALLATSVENLSVLPSGPAAELPVQLLESDRMQRLVKELAASADFVIIDTPPVTQVGDALTVAGMTDGAIFVVGSGMCEQSDVAWAKHLLNNVQANLLGVFLNRSAIKGAGAYSYHYQTRPEGRRRSKVLA